MEEKFFVLQLKVLILSNLRYQASFSGQHETANDPIYICKLEKLPENSTSKGMSSKWSKIYQCINV